VTYIGRIDTWHRVFYNDALAHIDRGRCGGSRSGERGGARSEYHIGNPNLVAEELVEVVELLHVEDWKRASLEV